MLNGNAMSGYEGRFHCTIGEGAQILPLLASLPFPLAPCWVGKGDENTQMRRCHLLAPIWQL